jgi:hypothetical protein
MTPKESIIEVIRKNMSGMRPGRSREQLHASDITKEDFCPRKWALQDLQGIKEVPQYLSTALATTFSMGSMTAKTLIGEWSGESVIGNWECVRCKEFRTMTSKPTGYCATGGKHIWEYNEVVIEAPKYSIIGSLDAIFNLGSAYWRIAELKIMAPTEFDTLLAPLPEHRIRTSLYMKLIEESNNAWKPKFNLSAATVLYVSRGYGKKNAEFNEILPFKEFTVKRDDDITKPPVQKAKALKIFREEKKMPTGICNTALDKVAQKCEVCKNCFSGDHPANFSWKEL